MTTFKGYLFFGGGTKNNFCTPLKCKLGKFGHKKWGVTSDINFFFNAKLSFLTTTSILYKLVTSINMKQWSDSGLQLRRYNRCSFSPKLPNEMALEEKWKKCKNMSPRQSDLRYLYLIFLISFKFLLILQTKG